MSTTTIRPAYPAWPALNRRLRDRVATLTDDQLAIVPAAGRWPVWASIGHLACQRVFWLCDFAGEPGADTTPFRNAAYDCPGDDDLEHVLDGVTLAAALDATFRIVDACLEHWTPDSLAEVIRRPEWDDSWMHARGAVIGRVYAHDVSHVTELNETLGRAGLPGVDIFD
jgi:hypothetical protein